jgi:DNA polymerase-1
VNYHTAADPWVQKLLEYRSIDKLLTTYLRVFPERAVGGRIYWRFNSTGTKTGRLSSSEPNLQNIPSHGELGPRTRDLFRPRGVAA